MKILPESSKKAKLCLSNVFKAKVSLKCFVFPEKRFPIYKEDFGYNFEELSSKRIQCQCEQNRKVVFSGSLRL